MSIVKIHHRGVCGASFAAAATGGADGARRAAVLGRCVRVPRQTRLLKLAWWSGLHGLLLEEVTMLPASGCQLARQRRVCCIFVAISDWACRIGYRCFSLVAVLSIIRRIFNWWVATVGEKLIRSPRSVLLWHSLLAWSGTTSRGIRPSGGNA
jgi:hypothetical protein